MLLSVSVDLDETRLYESIHATGAGAAGTEVYDRAVPRISDWARHRGIPITWFVVGRDLERGSNREAVSQLASRGDEFGTHSFSHYYDLTRRPVMEMRVEIERGITTIRQSTGQQVLGFRAPGYVVSDTLLDLIREVGLQYDSSVFPCPSYYALKFGVLAAMRARGKTSASVLDAPQVLKAPTSPYRVGRPYWFRGGGIWEIPIQVTRRGRLPFIGTALTMAGTAGARLLAHGVVGEPFVNLELHGIDALDQHDGLTDLAVRQRDLRIPWAKKLAAIDAAVSWLCSKGHQCVRMDELAAAARRAC